LEKFQNCENCCALIMKGSQKKIRFTGNFSLVCYAYSPYWKYT
jgi:hypothetical protein